MTNPMFASIRKYNAAPLISEELVKHQDAIKTVLGAVPGFCAYYLVKTTDGAVSLTVCSDRAGAEESNRVASNWMKENLPVFASRSPEIMVGEVRIQLETELARVTV